MTEDTLQRRQQTFHYMILGCEEEPRALINTDQSCCEISIVSSMKLYSVLCVNMHIFSLKVKLSPKYNRGFFCECI